MIAIIDYGMGNLRSVQKAFEKVGARADIVREADAVDAATKVVLPGVGAFDDAMRHLQERELIASIRRAVAADKPFLGICLGLQLLFDVSYEDGEFEGLGIVPGRVVRFDFAGRPDMHHLKVPHMGWNQVRFDPACPLFDGIRQGEYFYFVHSYHVVPTQSDVTVGRADYGGEFTAAIWRNRLFAAQFHPEKSQAAGLKMLANFAAL